MDAKDQANNFAKDLDRLVDRYSDEYDLTYDQLLGVLQIKMHLLCVEAVEKSDEP